MEDKIVGPLTMAQFLYLLVGGMVIYVMLQTIAPVQPTLFFALALPIGIFAIAMAFLKINDIPFPKFVQAAILYLLAPKQRVWHKQIDVTTPVKITPTKAKEAPAPRRKKIDKSQIEQLAAVLDTAGWAAVRDAQIKQLVKETSNEKR